MIKNTTIVTKKMKRKYLLYISYLLFIKSIPKMLLSILLLVLIAINYLDYYLVFIIFIFYFPSIIFLISSLFVKIKNIEVNEYIFYDNYFSLKKQNDLNEIIIQYETVDGILSTRNLYIISVSDNHYFVDKKSFINKETLEEIIDIKLKILKIEKFKLLRIKFKK